MLTHMPNLPSLHIEIASGACGVAGKRITVQNMAVWHEGLEMSADRIADEYGLTLGEVHAALAYYHDNRAEIDAMIRADEDFARELGNRTRSKIKVKTGG